MLIPVVCSICQFFSFIFFIIVCGQNTCLLWLVDIVVVIGIVWHWHFLWRWRWRYHGGRRCERSGQYIDNSQTEYATYNETASFVRFLSIAFSLAEALKRYFENKPTTTERILKCMIVVISLWALGSIRELIRDPILESLKFFAAWNCWFVVKINGLPMWAWADSWKCYEIH